MANLHIINVIKLTSKINFKNGLSDMNRTWCEHSDDIKRIWISFKGKKNPGLHFLSCRVNPLPARPPVPLLYLLYLYIPKPKKHQSTMKRLFAAPEIVTDM